MICQACGMDVTATVAHLVEPLLRTIGEPRTAWLERTYGAPVTLLCAGCSLAAISAANAALVQGARA
jgi:hypothetical protein